MPHIELPSIQRASVALDAFNAAILMCSWKLSFGLNHSPRYLMLLAGVTSFSYLGLFVGIWMDGLEFWFLDFEKCISSYLIWSVFKPLLVSHMWVSSNAIVMMWAVESSVGPDARMAPLST